MWIHLAECLPNVIAARVIFLPFSKFLKASQGTPFSKSISVAKGCSANGWSSQMRTTDSCDRNLSTLHSQKISDVKVQIMFAFVSKARGGCSTTKFTSSPSDSSWPRSPDRARCLSSTSCRSASAAMAAWATPASSALAPRLVRSMSDEVALPMLPKEDCVLSIRFFFGGVLGGGLMVTMLPRAAPVAAAPPIARSVDSGSPRPLPSLCSCGPPPRRNYPSPRRLPASGGGAPAALLLSSLLISVLGPNPYPSRRGDRRPLFGAGPTRPPEASPPSDATASEMGRGWPWQ